jgi:hypothetical protein
VTGGNGFSAAPWFWRPMRIWIIWFAARQEPAPLEMPQGRSAGPALRFEVAQ